MPEYVFQGYDDVHYFFIGEHAAYDAYGYGEQQFEDGSGEEIFHMVFSSRNGHSGLFFCRLVARIYLSYSVPVFYYRYNNVSDISRKTQNDTILFCGR
ncbi:MAG: hypothetical protein PUB21_04900 [Bacteroidales bacterium]|nr:hypothetical protein [Bacteroidales bacterium]